MRRPLGIIDSQGRLAGTGDYSTFGRVNRVSEIDTGAHPYAPGTNAILSTFAPPVPAGMSLRARARFHDVDTASLSSDYATLTDHGTGADLLTTGQHVGGAHQGRVVTDWVTVPASGIDVHFYSDATANSAYLGTELAGFDYQMYETGASPVWIPLRAPGQYHDSETDWDYDGARYCAPDMGQFTALEPLETVDAWPLPNGAGNVAGNPYQYALDNPAYWSDPNGRQALPWSAPLGLLPARLLGHAMSDLWHSVVYKPPTGKACDPVRPVGAYGFSIAMSTVGIAHTPPLAYLPGPYSGGVYGLNLEVFLGMPGTNVPVVGLYAFGTPTSWDHSRGLDVGVAATASAALGDTLSSWHGVFDFAGGGVLEGTGDVFWPANASVVDGSGFSGLEAGASAGLPVAGFTSMTDYYRLGPLPKDPVPP